MHKHVFHLHICSMAGDFYNGECVSLTLPLSDGILGVMARRSPFAAAVVPGLLRYCPPEGEAVEVDVGAGIARFENNDALVLLDSAVRRENGAATGAQ